MFISRVLPGAQGWAKRFSQASWVVACSVLSVLFGVLISTVCLLSSWLPKAQRPYVLLREVKRNRGEKALSWHFKQHLIPEALSRTALQCLPLAAYVREEVKRAKQPSHRNERMLAISGLRDILAAAIA